MIRRKRIFKTLYFWVVLGIVSGILFGIVLPDTAKNMKPLGDAFIRMVKMIIAPIIFCTVVVGIAKMGDMRKVGRVGLKTMVYFWTMTLFALIIGLVVVNVQQPGVGMNLDPASLDASKVAGYASAAQNMSTIDFLMNIIPNTLVDAFAKGEILQVLFISIPFGMGLASLGPKVSDLVHWIDMFSKGLFKVVGYIMYFAPFGAFGAMAYVVGEYGAGTLKQLFSLLAGVYITCIVFVFGVLWTVSKVAGFSLLKYLRYIKEEILLVLGTSSSESALPRMLSKMEHAGCDKSIVGLTLPMGYSFNLDGTCIYLTMAFVFLAQATNTPLDLATQLYVLCILLLTSKGAAAVTGGGFIVLAATMQSLETVPIAALAVLLGVDRFMSEARAITNLIGNGVATIFIAKWENALDVEKLHAVFDSKEPYEPGQDDEPQEEPERA